VGSGERDLANESFFEYGSRVGVWRLMNVLDENNVNGTFFACALALEWWARRSCAAGTR